MKKDLGSIILTRQELQIMKVVWDRQLATVREVCDTMCRNKPTAYTTVLTLMGILEEKGALTHFRSGRAYVYQPILTRHQATRNQLHDIVLRFFDGHPEKLVEEVIRHEVSSPEQLLRIKDLLETGLQHQLA